MKNFKKITVVLLLLIFTFLTTGCFAQDSNTNAENYTEQVTSNVQGMYGFPSIINYTEYKRLLDLYELRDDPDLICYWYTQNQFTGKWVYQGECLGYGIPYGASLTNPEEYVYNGATIPLAEPNGLFTNTVTSSATWIIKITSDGKLKPDYVESEIRISPDKIDENLCEEWSLPSDY